MLGRKVKQMFGLFHLLCAVTCVASSLHIYEMCPGTSFYIPQSSEYDPKTSDLYFTPPPSPGSMTWVKVLEKMQPTDDHYQYKAGTLFISALRENDTGSFFWSDKDQKIHTVLKLVIKDCAVPKVIGFGEKLRLKIPQDASSLEFVHRSSPDVTDVVWNNRDSRPSQNQKGSIEDVYWTLPRVTYADAGSYTFRTQSGTEISKTQVTVTASVTFYNMDEEDPNDRIWKVFVPMSDSAISVDFSLPSGEKHRILLDGDSTDDGRRLFGDRIQWYENFGTDGKVFPLLTLNDIQRSDAGMYRIYDRDGNLVAMRILSANPQPAYFMYLLALIPLVLLILLCVCVKKCCCKKAKHSTTSNSNYQPAATEMTETTNRTATNH